MIDFIRLLKDNNIDLKPEVDGWIQINCPWHPNGTRGYKGGINLSDGHYNCWNCGSSPIEKVFAELLSISFYEAKKLLQEYDTESRIIKKISKKALGKEIILPGGPIEKEDRFYKYLYDRSFDPLYLINTYSIRSGGIVGYWNFRIIIPIFVNNKIVTFQGRSIFSKEKCLELGIERYQTLEIEKSIINAKHTFYGLDECKNDWVVLVEGPFDRWRLGPNNVLSSLGTSTSEQQIILLAERYKKIIFLFDNEKEAQSRAKKYGERLAGLGVEVEIFNPEFEHDPGDYTKEEENFVRKELQLF